MSDCLPGPNNRYVRGEMHAHKVVGGPKTREMSRSKSTIELIKI
jgi:hypothetical protein